MGKIETFYEKITAKFARIFRFIDDIPKNLTVYRQTT